MSSHTFAIQGDQFLLDGEPFQIRSGEIHYNRVPRAYWRDRLTKAKAMGLNTICTYVFWNEHEPEHGKWDFHGNRDVRAFVELAGELGLWVIVRPGPYVCSEWEWGGFPYWLATIPDIQIRQNNPEFLMLSDVYMRQAGKQLADLTITKGGPIILAQVENEYGSFGSDHDYMEAIREQVVRAGFDCELFTSDGPTSEMLAGGTLPGVCSVINFGSRPEERFAEFSKFRQDVPRMCGELWFGWFDHWGEKHHITDLEQQTRDLRWFMETGASFNLYMFHGGTNWGFMNGANWTGEDYRPDVSSYDYDSALPEDGRISAKWKKFRGVIQEFVGDLPEIPSSPRFIEIPEVIFEQSCPLISLADEDGSLDGYLSFEDLHQGYGYVLYSFQDVPVGRLAVEDLQDYAIVLSDGVVIGTLDRRLAQSEIEVPAARRLQILVENSGRINYGREMLGERKGVSGALLNGVRLESVISAPLRLGNAEFEPGVEQTGPALYRAIFELKETGDVHLDLRGWGKGNVWVNGFNLGRHWKIGPQRSTYCPAPLLRLGANEIVVSDLEPGVKRTLAGSREPILG
jgi:beta-galactosidase